uniref:Uncharacterized protein K02A2.6 n=1 Tax=Cacopsylla melanoneura TaxID=428564 RepID=A0A8D8R7K3_9HEMI
MNPIGSKTWPDIPVSLLKTVSHAKSANLILVQDKYNFTQYLKQMLLGIQYYTVHLDISGKLSGKNNSKEYLFVFVDAFTKYTLLFLTKKLDGDNAVRVLLDAISLFGSPSLLVVDQGRSFANKKFKGCCAQNQITLHFMATGSCRANGQVERQMRVL